MIFYKFCKLPEKRLFFFMLAFKKISTAKKVDNLISFLLKYLFTIILVLVFLIECNLNKFTLHFVIILLPFDGFYQMIYLSSCYLMNNLNFLKDVELIKCIYLYEFVDCNIRRSEYLKELPENLKNYLKKILS